MNGRGRPREPVPFPQRAIRNEGEHGNGTHSSGLLPPSALVGSLACAAHILSLTMKAVRRLRRTLCP
jgi:hypothetical protein